MWLSDIQAFVRVEVGSGGATLRNVTSSLRRVLLIEDDESLATAVAGLLVDAGYDIEVCLDGPSGSRSALTGTFDLVILDLMLPRRNGFSVCSDIRDAGLTVPIVVLTAKNGDLDKVECLELGADDFVRKPFDSTVLVARVNALMRRHDRGESHSLVVGPVALDPVRRRVSALGVEATLTPREFRLLEYLMERPELVVHKSELLEQIWGADFEGDPNVVEVYIGYLRRKLATSTQGLIRTVRGVGYQFTTAR